MEDLEIVKIGGKILEDTRGLDVFIEEFKQINGQKILVHGGGNKSTTLAATLGLEPRLIDGRRITDPENLEIIVMVYAGWINKSLVSKLQSAGIQSLGLSGADLNMIRAKKRIHPTIDFGEVGDIDKNSINTNMLKNLLKDGITPVFCAVTHNGNGALLNTNADTIAAVLASSLADHFNVHLTYCFEYNGVLANSNDPGSWLEKLSFTEYGEMVTSGAISKGMIPKLDNAFSVLKDNVKSVFIKNATRLSHRDGTQLYLN